MIGKLKSLVCFLALLCSLNGQAQIIPVWKIESLTNYISGSKHEVLVVNFWATYCKPCIAEMPGLISAVGQWPKGKVKLIFVSLDLKDAYPRAIQKFVVKRRIKNEMYWLNETDANYFCPKVDSAWGGSIPATLIVNTKTGYRKFIEDGLTETQMNDEIRLAIKKTP